MFCSKQIFKQKLLSLFREVRATLTNKCFHRLGFVGRGGNEIQIQAGKNNSLFV